MRPVGSSPLPRSLSDLIRGTSPEQDLRDPDARSGKFLRMHKITLLVPRRAAVWWLPVAAWSVAWATLLIFDARLDLASKALILVLTSAAAAMWWPLGAALCSSALAVLAFNLAFVPPRGSLAVDLHQHVLLLATIMSVSGIVAYLMNRLRRLAVQESTRASLLAQLRQLGETLRTTDDGAAHAVALASELTRIGSTAATVLLAPGGKAADSMSLTGPASSDEVAGLHLCLGSGQALGPGTGRHEEQPAWYLPLRGRTDTFGAALVMPSGAASDQARSHAQALCDQVGTALERANALRAASAAREEAQAQALRNTLLAAISHDHRTPLATILGAASALHDQNERLSPAQRQRFAATIIDEASQLARLTDNTLQLARLEKAGLPLQRDWESVEEIVGATLRHVRQRRPEARVVARVESGLPLLRCDVTLVVQLLDNLVDNALQHGESESPVEVVARLMRDSMLIGVCDRGPGVPMHLRKGIFEVFQRGDGMPTRNRRGAGVGLALCRAIAHAHGGELRVRARNRGGSSFELTLPIEAPPGLPASPPDPPANGAGP